LKTYANKTETRIAHERIFLDTPSKGHALVYISCLLNEGTCGFSCSSCSFGVVYCRGLREYNRLVGTERSDQSCAQVFGPGVGLRAGDILSGRCCREAFGGGRCYVSVISEKSQFIGLRPCAADLHTRFLIEVALSVRSDDLMIELRHAVDADDVGHNMMLMIKM
jgi:hypothetical protein